VVDDQGAVVISIDDDVERDLDSVPLKVKEPRAFTTLLRNGVFMRRRRTNGVNRCLLHRNVSDERFVVILSARQLSHTETELTSPKYSDSTRPAEMSLLSQYCHLANDTTKVLTICYWTEARNWDKIGGTVVGF